MDAPRQPDGPPIRDGKPYSRIAHLAEDVRPFVAIAGICATLGLSAPEIIAADLDAGLLLIEDLGDRVFGAEVQRGADPAQLWRAGVDALVALRRAPVASGLPSATGTSTTCRRFDRGAMQIEVELLPDWYVPALTGRTGFGTDRAAIHRGVVGRVRPPRRAAGACCCCATIIRRTCFGCRTARVLQASASSISRTR